LDELLLLTTDTPQKGEGDRKFVPGLSRDALGRLASLSPRATELLGQVVEPMLALQPSALGFGGPTMQSSFYPSPGSPLAADEVVRVDRVLAEHGLEPENTRIRKVVVGGEEEGGGGGEVVYEVLVASVNHQPSRDLPSSSSSIRVRLVHGDHSRALGPVVDELAAAAKHGTPDEQQLLALLADALTTGDQNTYRASQAAWVGIRNPRVETSWGFIEPYRDPAGVRGEWQAEVRVLDEAATARMDRFGERAEEFTALLPWAEEGVNNGKGAFEPPTLQIPTFTVLHGMRGC
jgi:dipeptidyl-peptidase-3